MSAVLSEIRNESFCEFLSQELSRRITTNSRYSLRAFARLLRIEPSALSQIINKKRPLTDKMCERFGQSLRMSPMQIRQLMGRPFSQSKEDYRYQLLQLDSFHIISDWYHYAILEMIRLKNFQGDSRWIASELGISVTEVNQAIKRLQRTGMLKIESDGRWVDLAQDVTNICEDNFTAPANRKLQTQILQKGQEALEEIPIEDRSQTSMTVPVNKKNLKEAKKMINQFRRELGEFLRQGEPLEAVYHLSISLYPVTGNKKSNLRKEK